jgi:hypothetical protein
MGDDGRVVGDPTEVLTRSGGSSYVSLTGATAGPVHAHEDAPVAARPSARPASDPSSAPVRGVMFVGWLALAAAVLAAVLTGLGVVQVSGGGFVAAATIAWVAIVVSSAAVAGGILAVIAGFGRLPGAIAIALGLVANPFLLTRLLDAVGQLNAA